jgi:hypothetical protein
VSSSLERILRALWLLRTPRCCVAFLGGRERP